MNIHIVNAQLFLSAIILTLGIADARLKDNPIRSNDPSLLAISNGVNQFNNNFFKTLANDESNNFVCSPVGLNILLSMINFGARGTTKEQLESSLNLPKDENLTKQGYQHLIDLLNNIKGAELRLANKLLMTNECDLLPEFDEITKTHFKSETQRVDFTKPEDAAVGINNWCANKTNNHISKLFVADDLEDAELVLVNAVYFKGSWKHPFDPELTKDKTFHITEETALKVPMMHIRKRYARGSIADLNATFIKLPYQSNNDDEALSMYIIRPDDINGLKSIESNFEKINFARLDGFNTKTNLFLPKFKVENKFDLKPTLEKMGITRMFETNANFQGINDQKPLSVGKIIQKAFIEVNEKGSEAAAATGVTIGLKFGREHPQPELYIVDRPFIYAIIHESTNTVLFQGHVHNPIESK